MAEDIKALIYLLSFVMLFKTFVTQVYTNCPADYKMSDGLCWSNTPALKCPYIGNVPFVVYSFKEGFGFRDKYFVETKIDDVSGCIKVNEVSIHFDIIVISGMVQRRSVNCLAIDAQEVTVEPCENLSTECAYDLIGTFCEAYDQICSDADPKTYCSCKSQLSEGHFCRLSCNQHYSKGIDCSQCDLKFRKYPPPKLTLSSSSAKIYLQITSVLRLKKLSPDFPIKCYSDFENEVFDASVRVEPINNWHKFHNFKKTRDEELYEIKILNPRYVHGRIWCKGFVYPNSDDTSNVGMISNLKVITSNTILFRPTNTPVYVFNITVNFAANLYVNPYEVVNLLLQEPLSKINYLGNPVQIYKTSKATIHISPVGQELTLPQLQDALKNIADGQVLSTNFCMEETREGLHWPKVALGQTVRSLEMCLTEEDQPVLRKCVGDSKTGVFWGNINGSCKIGTLPESTRKLLDLLDSNVSSQSLNRELSNILDQLLTTFKSYDIFIIGEILEKLVHSKEYFEVEILVDNIGKIMDVESVTLQEAQTILNATDNILNSVHWALVNYADGFMTAPVKAVSKNFNVFMVDAEVHKVSGLVFQKNDEIILLNSTNSQFYRNEDTQMVVILPEKLVKQVLKKKVIFPTKLISAAFKKDTLFNNPGQKKYRQTGWIPDVFFTGFDSVYLQYPLKILIKPHRIYRQRHHCSFWEYGKNDLGEGVHGFWKIEPPQNHHQTDEYTDEYPHRDGDFYVCEFGHMTHFGLLLDNPGDKGLSILSLIGSSITLIAICVINATALISKQWRVSSGGKITLSLNLSIAVQIIVLFFAEKVDSYDQANVCLAVGLLLHYMMLTQFLWVFVVGILQYRRFIIVLTTEVNWLVLKSSCLAWIAPIVVVAITVSLNFDSYLRDQYCFLTGSGLYLGVFLPVSAIVFVNLVIFMKIFYELGCKSKPVSSRKQKDVLVYLRLGTFLFFLLGIIWVFGLLNSFFQTMVLSYVFCVLLSMQGVVMFLFHVILNDEAKRAWKKFFVKK